MEIQDQEQAYGLQGEFLSRAMKTVETLRSARVPPLDVLVKDNQDLLAAARARLDTAMKDREELTRRMDERILRLTDDVKRLEAGLADTQMSAGPEAAQPGSGQPRPTQPDTTKPVAKRSPKPPNR